MTELAVIDNDPVAPEPLTKAKAKALDKKIRAASDKVSTSTENLLDLLEEAAAGNIHEALELPSWTAWFADAVQISISDKHERKELVKLMSGKGMSQRAIAGTLGVSQKTVDRDLDGEQVADGETVTGLNGVEKPKTKAKPVAAEEDPGYIDAEVVDTAEDTEPPTPAADLVEQFNDETVNLWNAATELKEVLSEEKWKGARKRVAAANLNHIQDVQAMLSAIVDDLMVAEG